MSGAEFRGAFTRPDVSDMTGDQLNELLDSLTPVSVTPEQEAELVAMLPPPGAPEMPLNVVRSLRLPEDLNRRLDEAADADGIPASVFIRRAIESALAGRVKSNLVSLDDVYRALSAVPKAAA
jgi:predicted DNA-binding protein